MTLEEAIEEVRQAIEYIEDQGGTHRARSLRQALAVIRQAVKGVVV